ncbi:MAG: hypothetical protein M0R77_02875 [Gammaproteobacteria bacterium]|nr:hypothetical protein [Gammaproteobacteria bacterium]
MTIFPRLPEYASYITSPTLIGSYELLQSRTNVHPITVNEGQMWKLSFLVNPNTEQLIVRMTFSDKPLEYPLLGWYKSLPPGGITVYLFDENGDFPPPPEMIIQNRMAGSSKISPFQIPVSPGQYFINMQNLSNVKTTYTINIKN